MLQQNDLSEVYLLVSHIEYHPTTSHICKLLTNSISELTTQLVSNRRPCTETKLDKWVQVTALPVELGKLPCISFVGEY